MKLFNNATTVGILTLLVLVISYYGYLLISKRHGEENEKYYFTVVDDASGLVTNSRILMAGVVVGSIENIKLSKQKAKIKIIVNRQIELYQDAVIAKKSASILGEYILVLFSHCPTELRPCKGDAKIKLESGNYIKNVREISPLESYMPGFGKMNDRIERIMGSIELAASDIKDMTGTAKGVVASEEGRAELEAILKNITDITNTINDLLQQNQLLVNKTFANIEKTTSAINPDDLRETISHLRSIIAQVDMNVSRQDGGINNTVDSINRTLANLEEATENLSKTMEHSGNIAEDLDNGEKTGSEFILGEKMTGELENAVEGASDFVGSISRLQTIVGLRSEYNFYDNSLRTAVSLRLQPREDKYYLIEVVDDPKGMTSTTETFIETNDPDEPASYQEKRTITSDAFRISFMFARRLGWFTLRFGIKESSGGVGADVHLLNDHLELSTDLFSFGTDIFPRWRIFAALEFLKGVFITGGADDVLNEDRDYFIGFQIRFNDEDLRSILMFTPTNIFSSGR